MDGAQKTDRLFPSYTTAEIEKWVADGKLSPETHKKALAALAQRKAGNVSFSTPQAAWK